MKNGREGVGITAGQELGSMSVWMRREVVGGGLKRQGSMGRGG